MPITLTCDKCHKPESAVYRYITLEGSRYWLCYECREKFLDMEPKKDKAAEPEQISH